MSMRNEKKKHKHKRTRLDSTEMTKHLHTAQAADEKLYTARPQLPRFHLSDFFK